ncbi:MAG: transposase [Thermoanaerobacteraceae bacterium]
MINKADSLKIHEIESFVKRLVKDIDAVRNAIIYDYNNGLAEVRVNKLKVIKRIMYGRCSFDTLKAKVLLSEHMRKIN